MSTPKYTGGESKTNKDGVTMKQLYNILNPGGGFDPVSLAFWYRDYRSIVGDKPRHKTNQSSKDQEAYWAKYTGHNVPEIKPTNVRFEFDSGDTKKNEYIGTLRSMDLRVQAIADTLNSGKIYRNYKHYKKLNPDLPLKSTMKAIYKAGKKLLDKPNEWHQVNESLSVKHDEVGTSGLGALQKFGMRWNDKTNTIDYHDTYDFPTSLVGGLVEQKWIPERDRTLRIRGQVKMDPAKGSILLRDDMKRWNEE